MKTFPVEHEAVNDPSYPQAGEVIVVLARDGSARMLTMGMSPDVIMKKIQNEEELSEDEHIDLELTGKALALVVAANTEQIMSILEDITNNPEIIDPAKLMGLGRTQ